MNKSDLITTRDYAPADHPFIMSTFLRGLYYGDSWFSEIKKSIFMPNYHHVIEALLKKPTTRIRVACLVEDKDVILGYCVFSAGTVHYSFVKKAWRNIGIAKSLLPMDIKQVTHLTKVGLDITKKKGWDFNPFAI